MTENSSTTCRVLPTQDILCAFWAHTAWIYEPFLNFMSLILTYFYIGELVFQDIQQLSQSHNLAILLLDL